MACLTDGCQNDFYASGRFQGTIPEFPRSGRPFRFRTRLCGITFGPAGFSVGYVSCTGMETRIEPIIGFCGHGKTSLANK